MHQHRPLAGGASREAVPVIYCRDGLVFAIGVAAPRAGNCGYAIAVGMSVENRCGGEPMDRTMGRVDMDVR